MITAETGNITGNVLIVMVVSGWPSLKPRNISSSTFRRFITRCTTFAQQSQRDALCNARFGSDRLNSLVVEMSTSGWLWGPGGIMQVLNGWSAAADDGDGDGDAMR